jgi:hypothetical protein
MVSCGEVLGIAMASCFLEAGVDKPIGSSCCFATFSLATFLGAGGFFSVTTLTGVSLTSSFFGTIFSLRSAFLGVCFLSSTTFFFNTTFLEAFGLTTVLAFGLTAADFFVLSVGFAFVTAFLEALEDAFFGDFAITLTGYWFIKKIRKSTGYALKQKMLSSNSQID